MEDITNNKKINAYLKNTMTSEEAATFEIELTNNATLYEAYQEAASLDKLLQVMAYQQLKDKLKTIAAKEPVTAKSATTSSLRISLKKIGAIAASILLVLSAGSFWYANTQFSNQQLAQQYIEWPAASSLRGATSSELSSSMAFIQEEDYPAAKQRLSTITEEQSIYGTAQYFLGILYLETGEFAAASTAFQVVLDQPTKSLFYEEAYWHQVVVSLQQGQLSEVEQGITAIVEDSSFSPATKQKAIMLRTQLRSNWRRLVL